MHCQPCMGVHVIWIQLYGAREEGCGFRHLVAIAAVPPLQEIVIGDPIRGRFGARLLGATGRDTALQSCNDRSGYLVLDSEDILNVAVISFRPEVALGNG